MLEQVRQVIQSKSSKEVADYLRNVKGFNIVPIKYKTKVPELNSLSEFFNKKCDLPISDNQSIALLHGKLSGTYAIDLDHPDIITDLFNDANLILKTTMVVKTPKQGFHIVRAIKDNDFPPLNIKLINHEGKKIDIKTEGGYTLLPPSVHDEVHGNYQFVSDTLDPLPVRWSETLKMLEDYGYFEESKLKEKMFSDTSVTWNNWPIEELLKGGYTRGERRRKQNSLYVKLRKDGNTIGDATNQVLRINMSCRPEPLDDNELKHNLKHAESFYQKIKNEKSQKALPNLEDEEEEKSSKVKIFEVIESIVENCVKSKLDPTQLVGLVKIENNKYWLDINSGPFEKLLRVKVFERYNEIYGDADYQGAVKQYYATYSLYKSEIKQVYQRFAYDKNEHCIYYDPNRKDCKIIKITVDGFDYIDYDTEENPIFVKDPNTWIVGNQTDFKNCYERNPLEEYVNSFHLVEGDKILFKAHLISEFLTDIPISIMVFNGEQGTAKTTLVKMNKFVVDPDRQLIIALPEKPEDLAISLCKRPLTGFDNVSGINKIQSDLLCRSVTGAGISKRVLYTTFDEMNVFMMSKIMINGISSIIDEPDLLQRSIIYELSPIPNKDRLTDEEIFSKIEELKPELLGQIFDTLHKALIKYNEVRQEITEKPRMASFVIWAETIAQVLGYQKKDFLTAYLDKMNQTEASMIDRYPLLNEILSIVNLNKEGIKTTASKLFDQLKQQCQNDKDRVDILPRTAFTLGKQLRVLAPVLRSLHYDCSFIVNETLDNSDYKKKDRLIIIKKMDGGNGF